MLEESITAELAKRLTQKLTKHPVIGRHIGTAEDFFELIFAEINIFNNIFDKDFNALSAYFVNLALEIKTKYNIPFEDIMYVVEALESEILNLIEHKIIQVYEIFTLNPF